MVQSMSEALAKMAEDQGITALARRIGVKRQVLEYWLRKHVPAERVHQVAAKTGLSRAKLRPDLFR